MAQKWYNIPGKLYDRTIWTAAGAAAILATAHEGNMLERIVGGVKNLGPIAKHIYKDPQATGGAYFLTFAGLYIIGRAVPHYAKSLFKREKKKDEK